MARDEGAEDRRQEACVRADPARRPDPRRGHARSRAGGARRAYRALSRSRRPSPRSSISSRRRPISPSGWSSSCRRCWPPPTPRSPRSTGSRSAAPSDIRVVCLIAAPEGVERLRGIHPDVPIWTAADRRRSRRATPSSFRAWATPATAPTARSKPRGSVRSRRPLRQRLEMTRHPLPVFGRPQLRLLDSGSGRTRTGSGCGSGSPRAG